MEHLKKYWWLYLAVLIILIWAVWYFRKNLKNLTQSFGNGGSLKVTNSSGAEIYQQEDDGNMKGTGSTVDYDTTLVYTNKVNAGYCPSGSEVCLIPKDLYETSSGWLLSDDIAII